MSTLIRVFAPKGPDGDSPRSVRRHTGLHPRAIILNHIFGCGIVKGRDIVETRQGHASSLHRKDQDSFATS